MNASHDAYVTGSPALYSVFVQPSVVFLAILQLDVMRVAGAVYSATYDEGSCEQDMSDPVHKCSPLYEGRSSKSASTNGVMSRLFTCSRHWGWQHQGSRRTMICASMQDLMKTQLRSLAERHTTLNHAFTVDSDLPSHTT